MPPTEEPKGVPRVDLAPDKAAGGRLGHDVPPFDRDPRAEGAHSLEVDIHRTQAEDTAAGKADRRPAGARQKGSEHTERGAHLAHEFPGGLASYLGGLHPDRAVLGALGAGTQRLQDSDHGLDVRQIGRVLDHQRLVREKPRGEDRKDRVLGPPRLQGARKPHATLNDELVHQASLSSRPVGRASILPSGRPPNT